MKSYSTEELEEWIDKIENVNKKVKDIIDGKQELEELDKQELEAEKQLKQMQDVKAREQQELLMKGRPGKGHKPGYNRFCKFCFTEFMVEVLLCPRCNHDTQTYEERIEDLKDKLEDYKLKQQRKKERKSKWENWKKTQALFYKKTSTNYKKWDFFDSGSDSDKEDNSDPMVPDNDPNFKAMESDIMDRRKRRLRDRKEALALKDRGNDALKKGCYKTAAKYYSDALDLKKDLLSLYTNRALARLKIEDYQGVIDDCTQVLEYCEVFHDGFQKEKDLCYKSLMRRCQALRGQKDFQLALKDLEEANKLISGDKDVEKFTKLTQEDIEHEEKIKKIMTNADSLKGKEYIDYVLDFLQGKKEAEPLKEKKNCYHELTKEDAEKLKSTLEDQDMIYYFNIRDGMKSLVESLEFNQEALSLIQSALEKDEKLQQDFQKQKLYEYLIDFLYRQNQNVEGKNLESQAVHQILEILETASMNESVREKLSEKKKIKDLFLVVIRSIDISANRKLVSSLIQFVSNLCYGTGKFRQMLKSENSQTFFQSLTDIVINAQKEESDKQSNQERALLKQATTGFIGNLCVDPTLRGQVAGDIEGILSQIFRNFQEDVSSKKFDWQEQVNKQLAILVNVSMEQQAQTKLIDMGVVQTLESLINIVTYKGEEMEILNRSINLLAKIGRQAKGVEQIKDSKVLILKVLVYLNRAYPLLVLNSLRVFHCCCKSPEFKSICFEQHGLAHRNFDIYVAESKALFSEFVSKKEDDNTINICASISAFCDAFPERIGDFREIIVPLIQICKEKVDAVRKMAAVCLAKLSKEVENSKLMRANHGHEVLVSLGGALTK